MVQKEATVAAFFQNANSLTKYPASGSSGTSIGDWKVKFMLHE